MRSGQEQRSPQAAVTVLMDQGQHQAPCAGEQVVAGQGSAASARPQQDEAGFSLSLSPTALFTSRVWVAGSCATKATGTTFASVFRS